jgi:hypothetical protein
LRVVHSSLAAAHNSASCKDQSTCIEACQ